jgi:hypothetical protein
MARTIQEIYDSIIAEKETRAELLNLQPAPDTSQTFLDDLTSTSKVAIWRLLFYTVAFAIWVHEKLFDEHTAAVNALAADLITGTARWYQLEMFKFQFGDTLLFIDGKFQYAIEDLNAQIIKRSAVQVNGTQVIIKVAKLDITDNPIPLSIAELTAFTEYVNQIKFAGTNTLIVSNDADLLKIEYQVFYDPLVMDASGGLLSDPLVKPVEDAINNYISNLPFDGNLVLTNLTDAVQAAEGVVDPVIGVAEARVGALPFQTIVNKYNAVAGYMKIDPAYPLATQITYTANV